MNVLRTILVTTSALFLTAALHAQNPVTADAQK